MDEPQMKRNIAERIRMELAKQRWKQVRLAKEAGISPSTLGRKLRGDKEPFDVDELERICRALDLPPEDLVRSRCFARDTDFFRLRDGTKQPLDTLLAA